MLRFVPFICAVLLLAVAVATAQIPAKMAVRTQDIVQPGDTRNIHNGRVDVKTGAPRALYFVDYGPLSGTPENMARTYLKNNSAYLQIKPDLSDLAFVKVTESPMGYHVLFEQVYRNVPVYRGNIVVTIDRSTSKVVFYTSGYRPSLTLSQSTPAFGSERAYAIAVAHLNARAIDKTYAGTQLMVNAETALPRLSYRVTFPAREPFGDWEIFVDAVSGEVFSVFDRTMYSAPEGQGGAGLKVDGSGYGWTPDPLTQAQLWYGAPGFIDPGGTNCETDPTTPQLDSQRVVLALPQITLSGGVYKLEGPFVRLTDWDLPTVPIVTATSPDSFRYNREQSGFEDVMVYHHLDASQRYIQSLGFLNIQNNPIVADPHGFNCDDNSYYQPSSNRLGYGEGGVDDAEDADVVLHEYGHAIQEGSHPGWGGGESGALGEGFGDYWARSYGRSLTSFGWPRVFKWDAGTRPDSTGTFWAGRRCNDPRPYPTGGVGGWAIHEAGQLWSTVLMEIWSDIGKEAIDKCVLQSHFILGANPTMRDNAAAVIQADRSLYGGVHVAAMVARFGARNFVDPAQYIPQIVHTPLLDTEDFTGPYPVTLQIFPGAAPLDPSRMKVHWGRTGTFTDSLLLAATGNPNEYSASIPGNGLAATYQYYIIAGDSSGAFSTHPLGAPANFHSFHVGLDTIPPVIVHTPLRDQALIRWPAQVRATVTDNIGIDSVWVDFVRVRGTFTGSFPLLPGANNRYENVFSIDTTQLVIGDSIFYKVVARDRSSAGNITVSPPVGFNKFVIISTRGVVLVVDDDPGTAVAAGSAKGRDDRDAATKGASSRLIASTLSAVGFVVDTVGFAAHDTNSYANYDIVVWSAGAKTSSIFSDQGKRSALINRSVQGGKIWIEGGEVGYLYRKSGTSEVDPLFRRYVLRDSNWISDVSSANLVITDPTHPMFNTPHPITGPLTFSGSSYGIRDAMQLMPGDAGAKKIAGWSNYAVQGPDTAGVIVYGTIPDPNVGQIVFDIFSIGSISDGTVAQHLVENTAEFLMNPPGAAFIQAQPTALNFGPVQLGDSSTLQFRVKNLGSGQLSVTDITKASPRLTVTPTAFTLGSQETTMVSVTFRPVAAGDLADTLRFVSNAPSAPVVTVTGREGIPLVSVAPDSLYFSVPSTGDTTTSVMRIRNTGTDTLRYELEEEIVGATASMKRSREQQPSYTLQKGAADPNRGPQAVLGGGGPDAFGYLWIDSDEPGGPQFNWTDIIPLGGTQVTGWTPSSDDGYVIVTLPFPFPFYGNTYSSVKIVTNGFLSFDVASTTREWTNTAIPNSAEPNTAIYPWWDDLNLSSSGTVHYYNDANNRFIIQYTNVPHYGTSEPGVYTFQVILMPGGDIVCQYLDMQQTLTSSTIGIENATGSIALQVVYNATYVHNNLAVRFTRDAVPWMSTDPTLGVIAPGDSQSVNVRVHPGPLPEGDYNARLRLTGNITGSLVVPVRLHATGPLSVEEPTGIPTSFALMQNYPNPFNPATTIRYALPRTSRVTLVLYNVLGQAVGSLVSEVQDAGYHQVNVSGLNLASGVYFYRLQAHPMDGGQTADYVAVRKMALLK